MSYTPLFTKETKAILFGTNYRAVQTMLDFDFLSQRTQSVAAIVNAAEAGYFKCFFGGSEILIPVYGSVEEAAKKHKDASVFINYASHRSAFESSMQALKQEHIQTIVIIAEAIPENSVRQLIQEAKSKGKTIIGPATVGAIRAGEFRVGETGGAIDNVFESKLYRKGCVGVVSKSGGLLNELMHIVAQNSNGCVEGVAVGGDRFVGSPLLESVFRLHDDPDVKMLVVLGEVGGIDEIQIAQAITQKKLTKPIVAWILGRSAEFIGNEVQFGHAGAKSNSQQETASFKLDILRKAGAIVPTSFAGLDECISSTYKKLVKDGITADVLNAPFKMPPKDFDAALKEGLVRKGTNFVSTVSDDRGDEAKYAGITQSKLVEDGATVGDVISLLWLKKKLDKKHSKFFDLCIVLLADHGPSVSGAHNAIVTARAGKDVVSAVCAGLLTIGPRFGGAIDEAARLFRVACDSGQSPEAFVEDMKRKGIKIPGIGHRVKSIYHPDKRVELLKKYAKENLSNHKYLEYALSVEKVTTSKKPNLILNVDGAIAVILMDLFHDSKKFTEQEIQEALDYGLFNAIFIVARSIGFVAHALDQKRLKQGLYRHPTSDTLFMDK